MNIAKIGLKINMLKKHLNKKRSLIKPTNLSPALNNYINSLRAFGRNEIYETILLFILNKNFLVALEDLIQYHIEATKNDKKISYIPIVISQEYLDAINLVCRSDYFITNFSKEEIKRRKKIGKNIISEIILPILISRLSDGKKGDISETCILQNVEFPKISHKTCTKGGDKQITLIFSRTTPLNEINKYLKEIVGIKNYPKKKKMSLGRGLDILKIEYDIRKHPEKYPKEPHKYIEQMISDEMFKRYNKNLTTEQINKSLSRIKKIREQINTIYDK